MHRHLQLELFTLIVSCLSDYPCLPLSVILTATLGRRERLTARDLPRVTLPASVADQGFKPVVSKILIQHHVGSLLHKQVGLGVGVKM